MARRIKKRKANSSKYFDEEKHSLSDDWVEIQEDTEFVDSLNKHESPEKDIKIVINRGRITKKNEYLERLKKELLVECRRIYNDSNLKLHITSLIGWTIHLDYLNDLIGRPFYKALICSFLDDEILNLAQSSPFKIEKFMLWFKSKREMFVGTFLEYAQPKLPMNGSDYLMCTAFLRQLGLVTRLIVSMQPWNPKIDLVKSRGRFAYKKPDEIIEKPKRRSRKNENEDIDGFKTSSKKEIPLEHREMMSIINVCDPLAVDSHSLETQASPSSKPQSIHRKKLDASLGHNYWIEVFEESSKEWICIGGWDMSINDPTYISKCATYPLQYVVGVDQYGGLSDVTFKYSTEWLTATKKLQIVDEWWQKFLNLNQGPESSIKGLKVDRGLLKILNNHAPVPSKLSDCKNHPQYVLERDLLKFQVLYPYPPPAVAYIKDIPVYSRQYVFTLQSKERWFIKGGRQVIEGSECVKTTERRFSNKEGDVELFGKWQTTKVKPTLTPDGKLPKNSFGNIEIYKPWMLPQHCVHLPIQGILRVAKRCGIDVAPAVVGWEYSANSHPLVDGVIILEKDKDLLLEEWQKQQLKDKHNAILKLQQAEERVKKEKQKVKRAEEKAKATFSQYQYYEDS